MTIVVVQYSQNTKHYTLMNFAGVGVRKSCTHPRERERAAAMSAISLLQLIMASVWVEFLEAQFNSTTSP
jgi:hypothetical protein